MNDQPRILVVDDQPLVREMVQEVLAPKGYRTSGAGSMAEARRLAEEQPFDILISDLNLPDGNGLDLVRYFRGRFPGTGVVVITGYPSDRRAREAHELDVGTFIVKPFSVQQLEYAVLGALERHRPDMDGGRRGNLGMIGVSHYMEDLRRQVLTVASGAFPVLIRGCSGSGKEVVARAIHDSSSRCEQSMICVNCAAIPEHLEESEFFGHTRGAFTGAVGEREGIVAMADRSTLLLDEVGELSPDTQAKLLRFLDNGEFMRVGETAARKVDVRIISATNADLEAMVEEGSFREDLYYRLKGATIVTRPLDEHREDVPALVSHFAAVTRGSGPPKNVTADAMEMLVRRDWPGNIRELRYVVSQLCHRAASRKRINAATVEAVLQERLDRALVRPGYREEKQRTMRTFDQRYFISLLHRHRGNVSRAATEAGMDRSNLLKKLRTLDIDPREFRGQGSR